MSKIITDEKLIDEFLTRGVENVFPSRESFKKKLMSGERLRIYQGFDPSGPYLHVGHAIGIRAMRILQKLGHEVIFLVGDYTAKVGDPDKETARAIMTDEQIAKNMAGWKEQASQLIDFSGENPVLFKRNHEWLSQLKLEDLIKLMSQITVQRMLERDLFSRRMKNGDPIQLHEFIYPLMQGYDAVAMEVDVEMGGNDQTFNMLVGRDLVKRYLGKEKFVRTNEMMDAPDGRTMSKTKGNGINLADSAEEMFGKAMSYPDSAILSGLELLTDVPIEEIGKMKTAMENGENPMIFKKRMAFEIVKEVKGEEAARRAEADFETKFQEPEIAASIEASIGSAILEVIAEAGLAESKADAKRKIDQGGVSVDGKKIDRETKIIAEMDGKILKVGRKDFRRITVEK